MRALHLPGLTSTGTPPFHYPDQPAAPSDLLFSTDLPSPTSITIPIPTTTTPPQPSDQHAYTIRVLATSLTRGELSWSEVLDPARFTSHGGPIPGHDVVGQIETIHPLTDDATAQRGPPAFQVRQLVWGLLAFNRDGAAAELTIALESELAPVPRQSESTSASSETHGSSSRTTGATYHQTLSSIPLSGLTSWQALFDRGYLSFGALTSIATPTSAPPIGSHQSKVLITGAAGAVGLFAVQIAVAAGHHVIGICRPEAHAFVKELGTEQVFDWDTQQAAITEIFRGGVEVVFDTVGNDLLRSLITDMPLQKGSRIVSIAAPLSVFGAHESGELENVLSEAGVGFEFFVVEPSGSQLELIGKMVEGLKLKGFVDEVFGLEQGREGMERVEEKGVVGKRGRVVLEVSKE